MAEQLIISVGREYGSGGHEIAKMLAEHYNLPLYDRNLLDVIAKERNLDGDVLKSFDEKKKNKFLSRTVSGMSSSPEDNIAHLQFNYLKKKAAEGESFVIVGRCSEYVLKDYEGMISMFILSDREHKIKRIMDIYKLNEKDAIEKMRRHDFKRKEYHNSYCKIKWGDSRGYDISINCSRLGLEKTTKMIIQYIEARRGNI